MYIGLLGYVFIALAIVCDDYFVASLEQITKALGLSPDVAGAIERPMKSTLSAELADVDARTAVDVAISPGFLTQGDA